MNKQQQIQEDEYIFPYHYLDMGSDEHKYYKDIGYLGKIKTIKEHLPKYEMVSVLDAGCGDGRLCYELSKWINLDVTGVDYSERAIKFAKAFDNKTEYVVADLMTYKSQKKFDYIILSEVIEHFIKKDIDKILKNIHKLLKKNGTLIITVPHKNLPLEDKHEQHFDKNSIRKTVKKYFEPYAIFGMSKLGLKRIFFNDSQHIGNLLYPFRNKFGFVKKMYKKMSKYYDTELRVCKHYEGQRLFVKCRKK